MRIITETTNKYEYFDEKFLHDSIKLLKAQLSDLSEWSAYNGDKFHEQIHQIDDILTEIAETPLSAKEFEDAN